MINKKLLVSMICPIQTRSGYGERSRDLARAILKSGKYDLKIWPINWGNTPYIGLNPEDPSDKEILDCILRVPQLPTQPDIHIHVSVPNEFQPIGKYNIGFTAGIETDHVDPSWLDGANRMQLLVVSSEYGKKGFTETIYNGRDDRTGQNMELKLTTPVSVLFEGADLTKFNSKPIDSPELSAELNLIQEDFNYLFCGHWLQGDLGQDRKDVGMLIKTFFEAFKDKKKRPGLILKTSGAGNSITDKKIILDKIDQIRKTCDPKSDLPNVYLLHGDLTRDEMNSLYNHSKVKAHISFTKGEGFGRPLLEASLSAKPILVPKFSGHVDFLEHVVWLPGHVTPIHPSAQWKGVLNEGTNWYTVDYGMAAGLMREVFDNYKNYSDLGKRQAYKSKTDFSLDKMTAELESILETASNTIPKPVQLVLPKLKKITIPKVESATEPEIQEFKPIEHKPLESPVQESKPKIT